jgi:F5/8 type C domain
MKQTLRANGSLLRLVFCGLVTLGPACSSNGNNGGTGGAGGTASGTGGHGGSTGSGGTQGTGGSVGSGGSVGTGGAGMGGAGGAGTGGASVDAGHGGSGGTVVDASADDAHVDAVVVHDGSLTTGGAYVRTGWTATYTCTNGACPPQSAADVGDLISNAFDGNYQTRWSTGVFQSNLNTMMKFPLYFTVDMKQVMTVSKITTHPGCKDFFDSPGTITVSVSTDGVTFTAVGAPHTPAVPPAGEACPPAANAVATDTITFPATVARYIQLKGTQRTTSDRYWAIGEMNVFP